jgi:hypothetical protein
MWALNDDYIGPGNQPLLNQMVQMAALCGSATPTPMPSTTPYPTSTATITPTVWISSTWRVNAGGPNYTDTKGNLWVADTQYTGGTSAPGGGTISGTSDSALYDTQRYGGSFSYTFNVPAGNYQITLKFAETYSGDFANGDRVFNVSVNGTQVLTNLDVYSQVGADAADDKVFNNVAPASGLITIQFTAAASSVDQNALIEAIQIIPQPGTPTPTSTATITPSATATLTPTFTHTLTPTPLWTVTPTSTATLTPVLVSQPVLSPNPVTGGNPTVYLWENLKASSDVDVKIFTLAFRMVQEEHFSNVQPGGLPLSINLRDRTGEFLANGLYYLEVQSLQGRSVLKLLIIR